MKQKTRYNVRLAERKGVQVRAGRPGRPGPAVSHVCRNIRPRRLRHPLAGLLPRRLGALYAAGLAQPLVAEVEGEPVAALVIFRFARTAWYLYGMSRDAHRDKMPNHLLQWQAMRWAMAQGCTRYDFWGAPDEFVETDPLWGVWRFKEGFGGQLVRHIGRLGLCAVARCFTGCTPSCCRACSM